MKDLLFVGLVVASCAITYLMVIAFARLGRIE